MRISDWSSDVCSSDLDDHPVDIVVNIERPRRIDRIDLTGIEAHNLVLEIGVEQGDAEAELAFAVVAQASFVRPEELRYEPAILRRRPSALVRMKTRKNFSTETTSSIATSP